MSIDPSPNGVILHYKTTVLIGDEMPHACVGLTDTERDKQLWDEWAYTAARCIGGDDNSRSGILIGGWPWRLQHNGVGGTGELIDDQHTPKLSGCLPSFLSIFLDFRVAKISFVILWIQWCNCVLEADATNITKHIGHQLINLSSSSHYALCNFIPPLLLAGTRKSPAEVGRYRG